MLLPPRIRKLTGKAYLLYQVTSMGAFGFTDRIDTESIDASHHTLDHT